MIKATGFRVVIKPDEVEEKTSSGIVLALDKKLEQGGTFKGVILNIGPEAFKAFGSGEPWAKVGDRVIHARYAGKRVTDPETNEDVVILNDDDILAIETF